MKRSNEFAVGLAVLAAIHESNVHVSRVGCPLLGWSDAETKSNPSASALIASPTGSAPGAADVVTSKPKRTSVTFPHLRKNGRRPWVGRLDIWPDELDN